LTVWAFGTAERYRDNQVLVISVAPGITAVAMLFFIGGLGIGTASVPTAVCLNDGGHPNVLRIISAIRLRREISGEFWMVLSGLAAVVFAFLVMERPAAGALAMVWMIGWFAVVMGSMLVMLGFKLHSLGRHGYRVGVAQPPTPRTA
jgi:uncharacterized membrane protein HdeD (DUF308 family)